MDTEFITRTSTALLEGLKDPADESCWTEFDLRFRPLILAVARRMGLSVSDAQDAAQETMAAFLDGWRKNQYDKSRGRLRHWLAGICRHKIADIQRRKNRSEKLLADKTDATAFLSQVEDSSLHDFWDDEWEKMILRQCLEEVKNQVEPHKYQAFDLFVLQQLPARQVAQQLNITEDVVYQNKKRILDRIREILPQIEQSC